MTGSTKGYRTLHYVLKIGDRKSAIQFFKDVLGMKVLRHEEFEKGCEATCNGPYDGRWSKTMIGYGPEDKHFVLELTYNYGISTYRHGDCLDSIDIEKQDVTKAREIAEGEEDGGLVLKNNGYKFRVFPATEDQDRITRVNITAGRREAAGEQHIKFYESVLGMKLVNCANQNETRLTYGDSQTHTYTCIRVLDKDEVDRGTAFGRMAFACPTSHLPRIQDRVLNAKFEGDVKPQILTPLVTLPTPGKASVTVVIVADLSGHEICFVGDEDFKELSKVDPAADGELMKKIEEDKSDEWFAKRGLTKETA